MSLINNLLNDLEDRQACLVGECDVVLDGLSSVADQNFHQHRGRDSHPLFRTLLVGSLLGVLGLGVYRLMAPEITETLAVSGGETGTAFGAAKVGVDREIELVPASVEAPAPVSARPELTGEVTLRLDEFIHAGRMETAPVEDRLTVPPPAAGPGITSVSLTTDDDGAMLKIQSTTRPEYTVYKLDNPPRVVAEISHMPFAGDLPSISAGGIVRAVRPRVQGGNTLVVLDLAVAAILSEPILAPIQSGGFELRIGIASQDAAERTGGNEISETAVVESAVDMGPGEIDLEATPVIIERPEPGMVKTARTAEQYFNEARALHASGKVDGARAVLVKALEADPGHAATRTLLVSILIEQGMKDAAARWLEQGLMLHPQDSEWAKFLAHLYVDRGDIAGAVRTLRRSIPALQTDPEYYSFLAALLQRDRDYAAAADIYSELVELQPDRGVWWMGLGMALGALPRPHEARHAYEMALQDGSLADELRRFIHAQLAGLSRG